MTFRDELVAEPWRFDMLATLRRFERENADKPRIGDAAKLAEEYLVVSQNPYMEFPASNLEGAVVEPSGRMRLVARFLGMFGPQGALPLTTTEESYLWLLERDDAFPRFADIFQRRFIALFFRAWADARPIAQNDRPGQDRFRAYIGSMIGVGTPLVPRRQFAVRFRQDGICGPARAAGEERLAPARRCFPDCSACASRSTNSSAPG